MKKLAMPALFILLVIGLTLGSGTIRETAAQIVKYFTADPDMPFETGMTKEEYILKRAEQIAMLRGIDKDHPFEPQLRIDAIRQMESQKNDLLRKPVSGQRDALLSGWSEIGPNPIPNGQTTTVSTAVSGRVTSIDVHPTNPNIAYVGTAQGGLYRTLDGGATWTPLLDNALSLAIGAVTIDPINPSTVFVGTGEGNLSGDSFAGVGVYRINNADTSPVVSGPFETRVAGTGTTVSNGHSFNGTAITKILVDPTNDNRIFVANTFGVGGISGGLINPGSGTNGFIGLHFSESAQAVTPVFSRVNAAFFNGLQGVTDMVFEPGNSNNLLIGVEDFSATAHGVYRSTNAGTASVGGNTAPTFAKTLTTGQVDIEFAINKVGANVTTLVAHEGANGTVLKSTDGGATWPTTLAAANGFCGGQCFYDIAIAIDPTNASNIYLGGSANGGAAFVMKRSTDGGTSFTAVDTGLHADMHAIAIAPSNPAVAFVGNDGGIWQSTNVNTGVPASVAWTSRNNSTFRATQFMSLAIHPTDPNFTIGGTQDNGTNWYQPGGTWTRADFGDGGYSQIDQNAADATNVRMYHTYFNQAGSLMGYATVSTTASASDGNWTFRGCSFPTAGNNISCSATAVLFYAPIQRGPGSPNTIYYGNDRLYRSSDAGLTHTVVSQNPITSGQAISAIGISPQNDNVRVVGLQDGGIFGTTTGANPLTNLDPTNVVPNNYVGRAVIDPTNANTAYVTLSAFGVVNVWKTTNLNGGPPTWTTAAGSGPTALPQVPVNAMVIDPLNSNNMYVGTDIGVYVSGDAGGSWVPFGSGLPHVTVFDMAITSGRLLRIATHGRGLWQIPMFGPTAANVTVAGRVVRSSGIPISGAVVSMIDKSGGMRTTRTNPFGYFIFDDVEAGQTCIFSVQSKLYRFSPQTIVVNDSISDLILVANN